MSYLEDDTLRLRALEPDDLLLLYEWENDTTIWQSGDTITPYSKFTLKQYLASAHRDIYEQKQLRLVIERKATTPQAVGFIDLFDIDFTHRRAAVGILIYHPQHRQKGYALRALSLIEAYSFNLLSLHQLYASIGAKNTASIKLFTKAGYELAGTKKQWRKTADGWSDELLLQRINPTINP